MNIDQRDYFAGIILGKILQDSGNIFYIEAPLPGKPLPLAKEPPSLRLINMTAEAYTLADVIIQNKPSN